ncbi:MAG TPA: hypothetical protein VF337_04430 [Candidatus Limnocylindrales bacterium]
MSILSAMLRRNHIDERRLDELAGAGLPVEIAAQPAELAHLSACRRCRSLMGGFRRTAAVLDGAWADRPLKRGVDIPVGAERVRLSPIRPALSRRRAALPLLGATVLVALVATAGLLNLRGASPAATGSPAGPAARAGTGVVTRVPLNNGRFGWEPDGVYLLVVDRVNSRIYDRDGRLVGTFGPNEGWLDAGHLIDGDGHVWALTDTFVPKYDAYPWYGTAIANGHGAAALVVGQPACEGDTIVDWYRDGHPDKSVENVTVFGWSPDGKYVLKGHMDCTDQDAMLHGWKGHVDVVDFATGKVAVTVPGVRGEMAFNPSGTRLAAGSDADLVVADIGAGKTQAFQGFRFLSWLDDDRFFALRGAAVDILDAGSRSAPQAAAAGQWQIPSGAGPGLVSDLAGGVQRIVAADGSKTLLDLSASGLVTDPHSDDTRTYTSLQPRLWSPDGRMLALESADGSAVVMLSVDPANPGSVGTALPTAVASAGVLAIEPAVDLPGPVSVLVSDPARDSLWFLGGAPGAPIDLFRYDIGNAALQQKRPLAGTSFDAAKSRIAISPSGQIWVGTGKSIAVYDPTADTAVQLTLPDPGADFQPDPAPGAEPWVSGIAFEASGTAVVARNWVRSLLLVDTSLHAADARVDVTDGFPMTGDLAVVGTRAFVVVDPSSGLMISVDLTGQGPSSKAGGDSKASAGKLVAVGDKVLTAGSPPGWLDSNGGGVGMIEPALAAADLAAAGQNGASALYSNESGTAQWRDKDGRVSAQGSAAAGGVQPITAIALDAQDRLWGVEQAGDGWRLVELRPD